MVPSHIVAQESIAILTTPLLAHFLLRLHDKNEDCCRQLVERLQGLCDGLTPTVWGINLNIQEAPAAWQTLMSSGTVSLGEILRDGTDRTQSLAAVALMVDRDDECFLLPDDSFPLAAGDQLLLASTLGTRRNLTLTLQNQNELDYVLTGQERSGSWLGQLLHGTSPGK